MPTRHAPRKVDASQKAIVEALRDEGGDRVTVVSLADMGQGIPDLLIGVAGETHLAEVKDGFKVPSRQKLTEAQITWITRWRGAPVYILVSPDQARSWLRHRLSTVDYLVH